MVDIEGKIFGILVCRLLENAYFLNFPVNVRVCTYIQVFFMRVCKYQNQRVRRMANRMENLLRVFQKQKSEKH